MSGPGGITDVGVVIPHYGDPHTATSLVSALLLQAPDLEIVVVDDCSPVPMSDLAGVKVLRRDVNGGFGSAVNTGVGATKRPTILVLNSDLEVPDDFIARLLESAAAWWPAIVGPAVVSRDGQPGWTGRHFPTVRHQTIEWLTPLARWRDRRTLHEAVGHDTRCTSEAAVPVDWLVGAALLLPRTAFVDVGGFDERYFMNSEEVDLQRRLREIGLPSIWLGDIEVVHEGGGSSDPLRRRRWVVDARMAYARKWGGFWRLRAALTIATAINFAANLLRRLAGRDVHPVATAREEFSLIWR